MTPALSFVIPLYNSAPTIGTLVAEIEALSVPGGHEIVLVNDGSADTTREVCRGLVAGARVIDGRNVLDPVRWRSAGWTYRALGRP